MRYLCTLLMIIISLLLIACNQNETYQDLNGKTINFEDYHGKWLVINYWASWCKPCQQELPEINAFYRVHQVKDAMVVGVSLDLGTSEEILVIAKRLNIAFPVLTSDPAKRWGIQAIPGVPVTYLIDPRGKLKTRLLGEQTQKSIETAMHAMKTTG